MKYILGLLLILLPTGLLDAQEIRFGVPRFAHGVAFPFAALFDDGNYAEMAPTTIDSTTATYLTFDLSNDQENEFFKSQNVGALYVTASLDPGVEIEVSTGYDRWNFWTVGKPFAGDNRETRTFMLPFATQKLKGARFINIARRQTTSLDNDNTKGEALIDCAYIEYSTLSVDEEPEEQTVYRWVDILGRSVYTGTVTGFENEEFPVGLYLYTDGTKGGRFVKR